MKQSADFYISKDKEFSGKIFLKGICGENLNLDAMSFVCECYAERDETQKLLVICNVLDSANGILELYVPSNITKELTDTNWNYQVKMRYEVDDSETNVVNGKLILK